MVDGWSQNRKMKEKECFTSPRHILPAIIPVVVANDLIGAFLSIGSREFAHIPQLDRLVFAVGNQMATITAGIDVRQPVDVTRQNTNGTGRGLY